MRTWFNLRFQRWLANRLPASNSHQLTQRNLFIFLSRGSLFYLGICALLWIAASNFENNLIYSLCFFLLAVLVAAIVLTFSNLAKLRVEILPPQAVFAGDSIEVPLLLRSNKPRQQLRIGFAEMPAQLLAAAPGDTAVKVYAPAMRRGLRHLPRLSLETTFPLGIIRCWTYLFAEHQVWIYPKPMPCELQSCNAGLGVQDKGAVFQSGDEFHQLKPYRSGDSLVRIAWKQYAAGRGLLVSEFEEATQHGDWQLDYDQLSDVDPEVRLSKLCYAVLALSQTGEAYSLKLPGLYLARASGAAQESAALQGLTLFGKTT